MSEQLYRRIDDPHEIIEEGDIVMRTAREAYIFRPVPTPPIPEPPVREGWEVVSRHNWFDLEDGDMVEFSGLSLDAISFSESIPRNDIRDSLIRSGRVIRPIKPAPKTIKVRRKPDVMEATQRPNGSWEVSGLVFKDSEFQEKFEEVQD